VDAVTLMPPPVVKVGVVVAPPAAAPEAPSPPGMVALTVEVLRLKVAAPPLLAALPPRPPE